MPGTKNPKGHDHRPGPALRPASSNQERGAARPAGARGTGSYAGVGTAAARWLSRHQDSAACSQRRSGAGWLGQGRSLAVSSVPSPAPPSRAPWPDPLRVLISQWGGAGPHSAGSGLSARGRRAHHLASHSLQATTGRVTPAIHQPFSFTHRRPSAIATTREDRGGHRPDATAARPDGGALPGPGGASAWSSVPCEP